MTVVRQTRLVQALRHTPLGCANLLTALLLGRALGCTAIRWLCHDEMKITPLSRAREFRLVLYISLGVPQNLLSAL